MVKATNRAIAQVLVLALSACGTTGKDTRAPAVYTLADCPLTLRVRLVPDETHSGRYQRVLELLSSKEVVLTENLAGRWARAVRINLYADSSAPGRVVLEEQEYTRLTYWVDLSKGTFVVPDTKEEGSELRFVGAFDFDKDGRWRFIPASERGKLPLPEPER